MYFNPHFYEYDKPKPTPEQLAEIEDYESSVSFDWWLENGQDACDKGYKITQPFYQTT